jgi:hypothetical protein
MGGMDTASKDPEAALVGPVPGYFAVSRSFVGGAVVSAPDGGGGQATGPFGAFAYFNDFEPIARAGYSILIFHISLEEANRVRQHYGLPLLTDEWHRSSGREAKEPT